jgi:hypothetical protein
MPNKPMCSHPELIPTQWNQPKPEPCEMNVCTCGKNATCPVCGHGFGCYPCDCTPKIKYTSAGITWEQAMEKSLTDHADVWAELAKM